MTTKKEIYLNNTPNCNPVDRDEGAERVGMGVLLAKYYQLHPSSEIKESLLRYTKFLRNRLQESDYKTFSSVDRKGRNRAYNYAWVSELYFQMYGITKDKQYAVDGYKTLRSMVPAVWSWILCHRHTCTFGITDVENSRNAN